MTSLFIRNKPRHDLTTGINPRSQGLSPQHQYVEARGPPLFVESTYGAIATARHVFPTDGRRLTVSFRKLETIDNASRGSNGPYHHATLVLRHSFLVTGPFTTP